MMPWDESLIRTKYHLSIAERMYKSFPVFEEKRFIIGVIKELAKAVGYLIRAFLIRSATSGEITISKNAHKNLRIFSRDIAPKYLDGRKSQDLVKILEIEKAQKDSPVEFLRGDQIGFLVGDRYKFLRSERLGYFLSSTRDILKEF
jgi:hypothetical protein